MKQKNEGPISKGQYILKICKFIEKRWDYRIKPKEVTNPKEIAEIIKPLPMTVAIVLSDYKSVGGGLNVNKEGH